jgi:diaminopimelate decarboxylase
MIAAADPRTLVAPGHTRNRDGALRIAGIDVSELAKTYGTPLVVFDAGTFQDNLQRFFSAARPHGVGVAYAAKAFLVLRLAARLARQTELELDVCSLGEIATAERGGFPAARMYLHGCGKSAEELEAAIGGRVHFIVVDGVDELADLAARAGERRVTVALRINTGIDVHTHDFVRTGGENTKFGILPADVPKALAILDAHPNLALYGLHAHMGSQIFDEAPFAANLDALVDIAALLHARGRSVGKVLLGGGFGVDEDVMGQGRLDLATLLGDLAARAADRANAVGIPLPRLGIEPGRALVATAGTTLYRVAAIKNSGRRRFVVIDGSIADNPRPAIYAAYHQPLVAQSASRGELVPVTIAGRSCENDEMVDAQLPDDLRVGDLVALSTTGAYTYAMASNYNRFGRPAVVEVESGDHRLLARRENTEDVMRNDVL